MILAVLPAGARGQDDGGRRAYTAKAAALVGDEANAMGKSPPAGRCSSLTYRWTYWDYSAGPKLRKPEFTPERQKKAYVAQAGACGEPIRRSGGEGRTGGRHQDRTGVDKLGQRDAAKAAHDPPDIRFVGPARRRGSWVAKCSQRDARGPNGSSDTPSASRRLVAERAGDNRATIAQKEYVVLRGQGAWAAWKGKAVSFKLTPDSRRGP